MKGIILPVAIAATLAALPAAAELESYTVDPNHTFPSYEIGHFGYSTQRGRFDKTSGKITLDTAAKKGSADVTIDTTTIDTGHKKLEEHLRSDEFFNVAKFPTINFKSSSFTFDGDKVKSASGELTMLGITKPATLNVERFNCAVHPMLKKKVCGAEMTATVKRSDYGMTKYIPALEDNVLLRINVEAIKD